MNHPRPPAAFAVARRFRVTSILVVALFSLFFSSGTLEAQWSYEGVTVDSGAVDHHSILPDGEGGVWVVWEHYVTGGSADTWIQRFDADGYPVFPGRGIRAMADSIPECGFIFGAFPSDDGSIVLALNNYSVLWPEYPDTGYSIFGQKISLDGELLLGPTGVIVSAQPGLQWAPEGMYPVACSDGFGGFWVHYEFTDRHQLHFNGMNSDGTIKLEQDLVLCDYGGTFPAFCPDGEGGFWVVFGYTGTDDLTQYWMQHVHADGSLEWPDYRVALKARDYRFKYPLKSFPDRDGGLFILARKIYRGPILQHVLASGELAWGEYGVEEWGDTALLFNNGAVTEDGGFALLLCRRDYVWFYRLTHKGERFYDSPAVLIDSLQRNTSGKNLIIPDKFGNGFFAFHGWLVSDSTWSNHIRAHYITDKGEDAWAPDTVLFVTTEHLNHPDTPEVPTILSLKAVQVEDSSIVAICMLRGPWPYSAYYLELYKLTYRGRWLDVVSHPPSIDRPSDFQLLSAYPNPFNSEVKIRIRPGFSGIYRMSVYDLNGRLVDRQDHRLRKGVHDIAWRPDERLSAGVYFVQWSRVDRRLSTGKIVYLK